MKQTVPVPAQFRIWASSAFCLLSRWCAKWPAILAVLLPAVALCAAWFYLRCNAASLLTGCGPQLGTDIYDFQTLITGGMAILAALIALQPARRQLRKMNIQSSVMAREVVASRLRETEARRKATKETLDSMSQEFFRALFPGDPEAEPEINIHWAFHANQVTDRALNVLRLDQENRSDTLAAETRREALIQAATALRDCLYSIHAPASAITDEMSEDEIAAMEPEAERARSEVVEHVFNVARRATELDAAFEDRLKQLRQLIRQIDDLVIDAELTNS